MGRKPVRAKLDLDLETRAKLEAVSRSRTVGEARVERAKVLLAYASGGQVTTLAQAFHTNRFEFVFTPKHGSWLNLVEVFFAKMTRTLLRGIRVASKAELKDRILRHLEALNSDPVVIRWRYKLEDASVS